MISSGLKFKMQFIFILMVLSYTILYVNEPWLNILSIVMVSVLACVLISLSYMEGGYDSDEGESILIIIGIFTVILCTGNLFVYDGSENYVEKRVSYVTETTIEQHNYKFTHDTVFNRNNHILSIEKDGGLVSVIDSSTLLVEHYSKNNIENSSFIDKPQSNRYKCTHTVKTTYTGPRMTIGTLKICMSIVILICILRFMYILDDNGNNNAVNLNSKFPFLLNIISLIIFFIFKDSITLIDYIIYSTFGISFIMISLSRVSIIYFLCVLITNMLLYYILYNNILTWYYIVPLYILIMIVINKTLYPQKNEA